MPFCEEEEEEAVEEGSSSTDTDEEASQFARVARASKMAGDATEGSKHGAPSSPMETLPPTAKKRRTVSKRVARRVVGAVQVAPQVITFEMGQESVDELLQEQISAASSTPLQVGEKEIESARGSSAAVAEHGDEVAARPTLELPEEPEVPAAQEKVADGAEASAAAGPMTMPAAPSPQRKFQLVRAPKLKMARSSK